MGRLAPVRVRGSQVAEARARGCPGWKRPELLRLPEWDHVQVGRAPLHLGVFLWNCLGAGRSRVHAALVWPAAVSRVSLGSLSRVPAAVRLGKGRARQYPARWPHARCLQCPWGTPGCCLPGCVSGERAKLGSTAAANLAPPCPAPLALGKRSQGRERGLCCGLKTAPSALLVWAPARGHNPGIPEASQMVLSDITSSQGRQHAGTTDVTLAHCLALTLTPGGHSDPFVLTRLPGWGSPERVGCPQRYRFGSLRWELLAGVGSLRLVGNLGRAFLGGRVVRSSPRCGDTKGPVCPSLAHALHSHTLSSLGVEGAWKEKGLPLGPPPGLPLCQPRLEGAWCSGSPPAMTRDGPPRLP